MRSIHIYLIYHKGRSEEVLSAHSTLWEVHEWLLASPLTAETTTLVRLLDGLSGAQGGYKGSDQIPWRQEIFDLIGKTDMTSACKRARIQREEDWPQWAISEYEANSGPLI